MESIPYLEDIYPPNCLYAVTIRSPIAKGFLKSFQIPSLPEDYYLITAKDIPGKNILEGTNIPVLADENLSYIGEPAAILLGPDKTKLEELASRCAIITEEIEPVFEYDESVYEPSFDDPFREINIKSHTQINQNDRIITSKCFTGFQEHWYAEPIGAVSRYKDKKLLIVRTATQWTNHVKRSVMNTLAIEPTGILIEPTVLSLHMDGKLWYPSLAACHAALGTYITKKPVRLILKKDEDFQYTPKRCKTDIEITSYVNEKGKITKSNVKAIVNLGSFGVNEKEIVDQVSLGSLGFYKFDNLELIGRGIKTNLPPQGPFSGFGLAQGQFAIERHISKIADSMNCDPAIWRLNHADNRVLQPVSATVKTVNYSNELLNTVIGTSDYYRKWSSFELLKQNRKEMKIDNDEKPRGIGIALGYQCNDLLDDKGSYSLEVTLTKDGILEIKTGIVSSEDYDKIWKRVASSIMSMETQMIRVISSPADCGPSCLSRNITVLTKLVEKCCLAIKKQRSRNPLPITVRRMVKPQSGSLRNGSFDVQNINGLLKPGLCAAVVEVSIDPVECIPLVRGVWLAVDGGKIISVNRAKRSLTRAAVQALGWAYTENIEYINGALPRNQYDNYSILSPVDIPSVNIEFITESTSGNKENTDSKGIGDLPFTCIPAAFVQAVSQAMDHCFESIPLKRKDIWNLINTKDTDNNDIEVQVSK